VAQTRTQRLREAHEAEAAGLIQPDQSMLMHELPDGWSVVQLATAGDVRREAHLMRNCCAKYVGDKLDAQRMWVTVERSNAADDAPAPALERGAERTLHDFTIPGCAIGMTLHSLRDELGLPHLTFFATQGYGAWAIDGYRNSSPVKLAYRELLERWATETQTILADSFRKAHDAIRGRGSMLQADHHCVIDEALQGALASCTDLTEAARRQRIAWDAYAAVWDVVIVEQGLPAIIGDQRRSSENVRKLEQLFGERIERNMQTAKAAIEELRDLAQPVAA
jgi:hypothetical protein